VSDGEATVLETERLVLRHLTLGDLDELAALYRDPEVRRYFPEGTLTYEETRDELEWCIDVYDGRYGYGLWATVRKDRDELIGRCGFLPWRATETPEGELVLETADEHPVTGSPMRSSSRTSWGESTGALAWPPKRLARSSTTPCGPSGPRG